MHMFQLEMSIGLYFGWFSKFSCIITVVLKSNWFHLLGFIYHDILYRSIPNTFRLILSHNMLHTWCQLQGHMRMILEVLRECPVTCRDLAFNPQAVPDIPLAHQWLLSVPLQNLSFVKFTLFLQQILVESHILRLLFLLAALTTAVSNIINFTASPLAESMSLLITAMLGIFSAKDLSCPFSTEKLPTWDSFYIG